MRRAHLALIAIAQLSAGGLAHAQTYDPSYPVCMQIYGPVGYFDCSYASLAQCRYLAVGRSASCVVNPYFPSHKPASPHRPRRPAVRAG
ncbi:uncharacterized protein DUF3551 [Bradyrhizobium sp. R2.2-H]|jgi:hypothetical protein|uniref:DUF3551 domain-containing protein n=1 Tax=unclassified Bradyrhizobium TaxID=2631580 RepID=UPI0010442577|nr:MULTISPECIES: DUF3551 domain-containing protein [unclassified Bradyrhizobium]TCU77006.1 uncharacterized protein DUF3551 [Bradyrhizobium sp. Y-H1]TCU80079.1 uncharacterized protein DUF3551 [Bradyrhizobium sp. R2.2-H]